MEKYYKKTKKYEYDLEDEAWLDIQISRSLFNSAKDFADKDNISLNKFIENAIMEKVIRLYSIYKN